MNEDQMLRENAPGVGVEPGSEFKAVRFMSDQDYHDHLRAEREAKKARLLDEAEPVASAIERRLSQGFPVERLHREAYIEETALRYILDRRPPSPDATMRCGVQGILQEGEWRAALGALAQWLKDEAERRRAPPGHADTPTFRAVYNILTDAMARARLSVVIGAPGMGKSFAAQVLAGERPRSAEQPGAVLVPLKEADRTSHQCIESMLKAIRRDTHGQGGYAGLCRVLRPGDLLILDEAQRLAGCGAGSMVDVIRDLWEETGAGIVLIGNRRYMRGRSKIVGNDRYEAFLNRADVHDLAPRNSAADVYAWMEWRGLGGKQLADGLIKLVEGTAVEGRGNLRALADLYKSVQETMQGGEAVTPAALLEGLRLWRGKS
jgi:DNA transposition AAA+ family ATPase